MILEQVIALLHHGYQLCGVLRIGEVAADDSARDIVRRGHFAERDGAVMHYQAVAVADSAVECEFIVAEMLLHSFNDLGRLRSRDIAGRVIEHRLVFIVCLVTEGDEITAQRHVVLLHLDAYADRLERRAPGVAHSGVVAQNAEVGNVAARLQPVGNGLDKTHSASLGE